ncbi:MAG TPA: sigma-70 family RNA polymerase sigma factor [Candidatus Paceibacterota bacterium]|nr:sigma-70 family RNA polymerase sigma factor [Candidatus Paceibacterota bacterium]
MDLIDNQLIAESIQGREAAFAELVSRHLGGVYKFAYRYVRDEQDAEDIAQETFVRAWKNLRKFDASKNLKTWLFTIAKNASLDLLKKKKPLAFSKITDAEGELESFLAPYVASGEMPEEAMDQKLLKGDMDAALAKLPPAYRAVLALRYNEHLKFREIAEVLREPIDTVKSKHRRGLALLKNVLFP